jgi:hypothetical protein
MILIVVAPLAVCNLPRHLVSRPGDRAIRGKKRHLGTKLQEMSDRVSAQFARSSRSRHKLGVDIGFATAWEPADCSVAAVVLRCQLEIAMTPLWSDTKPKPSRRARSPRR